jgi:translation initiation factor 4E
LDLPYGSNYHLFRTGVKPAWEDEKNTGGGKWTLNVPRGKRDLMNEAWILAMMNSIGECHPEWAGYVCGAVCSVRKANDRISLWIGTCEREKAESIGKFFKAACGFTDEDRIKFEAHPKE